jgi:hypothetical protein
MTTTAAVQSRAAYQAEYYQARKEKLKENARQYYHERYKQKWADASEEAKAERRKKCNEQAAKTKPWLTRRQRRPAAYLFNIAKQRCKRTGTEFTITVHDIHVPEICPLLGVALDPYAESVDVHPSLDRIDPKKGYIPGNVWVVSHRANRIKSDANFDELIRIGLRLKELL